MTIPVGASLPPTVLLRLGASLGAVTGLALVALQTSSAWAADMQWTLAPWPLRIGLAVALGALSGGITALLVETLRRRLLPRVDALALCAGVVALLGPGARIAASAGLRARQGLPGGRPAAIGLIVLAVVACMALATARLHARHRRRLFRDASHRWRALFVDGAVLAVGGLTATHMVHVLLLASKEQAARDGLLGAPALAVLVGGLALGVLAGMGLRSRRRNVRRPVVALVLVALVAGTGAQVTTHEVVAVSAARRVSAARPHVLLVVLDTLRRDAVSAYGLVQGTTPHLDRLARQGVRFDDVLANGCWTVPSHGSLFTGAEVSRHGAGWLSKRLRPHPEPDAGRLPTLAELLADDGRHTAAFVCNMHVSRANGFDRGFAEFHELWRAGQGDYDVLAPAARSWLGVGVDDKGGALALAGLTDWLASHADDRAPWLLFVNLMEAHAPYDDVPQQFARAFLADDEPSPAVSALLADPAACVLDGEVAAADAEQLWRAYLGAVTYQDQLLGQLLAALDDNDLTDDVLVVVTSDHGENFGWQGRLGHGQDLNDDLLRIPLIVRGPGLPAGRVDPRPASLVDVLPTILALSDGPRPTPDPGCTGTALLGTDVAAPLADRPRLAERFMRRADEFARVPHDWRAGRAAIHVGGDKLVEVLGPSRPALGDRLSRRVGPGRPPLDDGRNPLADAELRARLGQLLRSRRTLWPLARNPGPPDPPPEGTDAARLAALGYLGH